MLERPSRLGPLSPRQGPLRGTSNFYAPARPPPWVSGRWPGLWAPTPHTPRPSPAPHRRELHRRRTTPPGLGRPSPPPARSRARRRRPPRGAPDADPAAAAAPLEPIAPTLAQPAASTPRPPPGPLQHHAPPLTPQVLLAPLLRRPADRSRAPPAPRGGTQCVGPAPSWPRPGAPSTTPTPPPSHHPVPLWDPLFLAASPQDLGPQRGPHRPNPAPRQGVNLCILCSHSLLVQLPWAHLLPPQLTLDGAGPTPQTRCSAAESRRGGRRAARRSRRLHLQGGQLCRATQPAWGSRRRVARGVWCAPAARFPRLHPLSRSLLALGAPTRARGSRRPICARRGVVIRGPSFFDGFGDCSGIPSAGAAQRAPRQLALPTRSTRRRRGRAPRARRPAAARQPRWIRSAFPEE